MSSVQQNVIKHKVGLFRAGGDHESFFTLGVSSDDDSSGWVMNEVEKNLRLCIVEGRRLRLIGAGMPSGG